MILESSCKSSTCSFNRFVQHFLWYSCVRQSSWLRPTLKWADSAYLCIRYYVTQWVSTVLMKVLNRACTQTYILYYRLFTARRTLDVTSLIDVYQRLPQSRDSFCFKNFNFRYRCSFRHYLWFSCVSRTDGTIVFLFSNALTWPRCQPQKILLNRECQFCIVTWCAMFWWAHGIYVACWVVVLINVPDH